MSSVVTEELHNKRRKKQYNHYIRYFIVTKDLNNTHNKFLIHGLANARTEKKVYFL